MIKTALYFIVALAMGLFMIAQLYDNREIDSMKNSMENRRVVINEMIDKID